MINRNKCNVTISEIYDGIRNFPKNMVRRKAAYYLQKYNDMMELIIKQLEK